jgi:hypothetical protein
MFDVDFFLLVSLLHVSMRKHHHHHHHRRRRRRHNNNNHHHYHHHQGVCSYIKATNTFKVKLTVICRPHSKTKRLKHHVALYSKPAAVLKA